VKVEGAPERIGRYRILRKLGEGGMGVVYAAHDEQLDRAVALKLIREGDDEQARKRFRREARAAAAVNHPNVCQLHEISEDSGALFIAMELLEGEPLSERIARGPLPVSEAVPIGIGILEALSALHARDLVHRDLKPSNVFLTPHGVKVLDFGLARALHKEITADKTESQLTQAGAVVGTPHYIAPEQLQAQPVDARADLFAAGAILFEMVSGRRAFEGATMMEAFHAALYEQPPALGGSPAVAVIDRVVRRALAKRPEDRHASAAAMSKELAAALTCEDTSTAARVVAMTRLIVLPFRVLRPDPETDFLAFSLPDAITTSLAGLDALVVRSSHAAARFAGDAPDLKQIAAEADVDVVLTGTLLRAGDRLRVATQLVEAPQGTLLWSHTAQVSLGDLFALEDELVRRIVESLQVPLTAREHKLLRHDVPASAKAYEFYLRANLASLDPSSWNVARGLYEQCLSEDARYAPAWARLGRVYRLLAKYGHGEVHLESARAAFEKALELNPNLPLAHHFYTHLEVESGRTIEALRRLLDQASAHSADPELYAAIVHVCRYAGLLETSLAADARARGLDPNVRTSIGYTFFMLGDYEAALATGEGDGGFLKMYCLATQGAREEALAFYRDGAAARPAGIQNVVDFMAATLEGDIATCRDAVARLKASGFRDPEGIYFAVRALARVGATDDALDLLRTTIAGGFFCVLVFENDPWLAGLQATPAFSKLLGEARAQRDAAIQAWNEAGGPRLLGPAV
jgi:TolB-like protein/tetratricopeptide (TPR) repeat protein